MKKSVLIRDGKAMQCDNGQSEARECIMSHSTLYLFILYVIRNLSQFKTVENMHIEKLEDECLSQ